MLPKGIYAPKISTRMTFAEVTGIFVVILIAAAASAVKFEAFVDKCRKGGKRLLR